MPILEEIPQPTSKGMSQGILAKVQEPQNQEVETQKEVQPKSTEVALEVNGMTQNLETVMQPDGSQTTISEHLAGETAKDASAWP